MNAKKLQKELTAFFNQPDIIGLVKTAYPVFTSPAKILKDLQKTQEKGGLADLKPAHKFTPATLDELDQQIKDLKRVKEIADLKDYFRDKNTKAERDTIEFKQKQEELKRKEEERKLDAPVKEAERKTSILIEKNKENEAKAKSTLLGRIFNSEAIKGFFKGVLSTVGTITSGLLMKKFGGGRKIGSDAQEIKNVIEQTVDEQVEKLSMDSTEIGGFFPFLIPILSNIFGAIAGWGAEKLIKKLGGAQSSIGAVSKKIGQGITLTGNGIVLTGNEGKGIVLTGNKGKGGALAKKSGKVLYLFKLNKQAGGDPEMKARITRLRDNLSDTGPMSQDEKDEYEAIKDSFGGVRTTRKGQGKAADLVKSLLKQDTAEKKQSLDKIKDVIFHVAKNKKGGVRTTHEGQGFIEDVNQIGDFVEDVKRVIKIPKVDPVVSTGMGKRKKK